MREHEVFRSSSFSHSPQVCRGALAKIDRRRESAVLVRPHHWVDGGMYDDVSAHGELFDIG